MLFTLELLIAELEKMRETHGAACQVGIKDADTNWTLPIEKVYFESEENRVLIFGDYHGDEFPVRTT